MKGPDKLIFSDFPLPIHISEHSSNTHNVKNTLGSHLSFYVLICAQMSSQQR